MKPMDPKEDVSVVIPVYNAAAFVGKTLSSVAAQSILPREVLVVDDGSSDNTCTVVETFCEANPQLNVRLMREPHCGPGSARNTGVRAATGAWVAFLDSDDLWEARKLERMAAAYQTMPQANFLCHNEVHRRIDNTNHTIDYSLGYRPDRPLPEQLYATNRFSTSAVICRRDLILSCGGFDNSLPNAQDYELWLRMSPDVRALFVREVLGVYVDRAGNISSGRAWRRLKNVMRVLYRHRGKVGPYLRIKTMTRILLSYAYRSLVPRFRTTDPGTKRVG